MASQDQQLLTLINLVNSPTLSPQQKQRAFNKLILTIEKLPGLRRSQHFLYLEAKNKTWEWLFNNISDFRPNPDAVEASLLKWVNNHLYWRVRDIFTLKQKHLSVDKIPDSCFSIPSLSGLEAYIEQEQQAKEQKNVNLLIDYIHNDPDDLLKNCYPKNHPDCHGQILIQRVLLQDSSDSFTQIAKDFQIKYQTLVSHWHRKVLPLLRTIAQKFDFN